MGDRGQVTAYLVDDVPELRALVRAVLERDPKIDVMGEADDPVLAIRVIELLQPDVVVLDLAMPGMDGLEALPIIRGVAPDTCVIVFSGFDAERMAPIALAHGADHYLQKGESIGQLRRLVRACRELAVA